MHFDILPFLLLFLYCIVAPKMSRLFGFWSKSDNSFKVREICDHKWCYDTFLPKLVCVHLSTMVTHIPALQMFHTF